MQRHALEALTRLAGGKTGAAKALPRILACCASRDDQVRRAAVDAAIAFGDQAVAAVRKRLAEATDPTSAGPWKRSRAESAAGTPSRRCWRRWTRRTSRRRGRRRWRCASGSKSRPAREDGCSRASDQAGAAARRQGQGQPGPGGGRAQDSRLPGGRGGDTDAAGVRARQTPAGRRARGGDRGVALRRARQGGRASSVRDGGAGGKAPAELARAALYSMASLEIPSGLAPRLRKLALGREPERALLAIERLAQIAGNPGGDGLAAVLTATEDRMRAEAAANALGGRPDGTMALARAFVAVRDVDRAALLARLIRLRLRTLAEGGAAGRKLSRALVASVLERIERDGTGAQVLLPLARELDREGTSAVCGRWPASCRNERTARGRWRCCDWSVTAGDASPEDGYALAAAELRAGRRDEALTIVQQLLERGFDIATALRRDRLVTPEQRYQVGFVLVERRQPAGEEVLSDLARAGRNKFATMAKAKLKSAGFVASSPSASASPPTGAGAQAAPPPLSPRRRCPPGPGRPPEQHVVAGREDDVGLAAIDGDDGGAGQAAQVQLLERAPHGGRARREPQGRGLAQPRQQRAASPARRGAPPRRPCRDCAASASRIPGRPRARGPAGWWRCARRGATSGSTPEQQDEHRRERRQERLGDGRQRDAGQQQDGELQRDQQRPPRRRRQVQRPLRPAGSASRASASAQRPREPHGAQQEGQRQHQRAPPITSARAPARAASSGARRPAAPGAACSATAAMTIAASSATSSSSSATSRRIVPPGRPVPRRRRAAAPPRCRRGGEGLQRPRQACGRRRTPPARSARISQGVSSVVSAETATATG